VLIDFHTHSTASDGALSPRELLRRAREAGICLLAITDHDTVSGSLEAARCAEGGEGPRLVSGIEFSCRWSGTPQSGTRQSGTRQSGTAVHVVGLGMDCHHPAMGEGLARLAQARRARGRTIGERLDALGFPGALEGALDRAGESQLGRPHFAAWMVAEGHAADTSEAFDRYLGQGKRGDVKAFWPELAEVTGWIAAAGGVAVLAHPLKYRFTRMKLRRLAIAFKAAGGGAIEIISGRQTPDQVGQLSRLARELDLAVSVGSDFHRDSPYGPQLGVELPPLRGLRGVWERWQDPAGTGALP
jgi:predicted metal-dependent phosphoesterase TrpH